MAIARRPHAHMLALAAGATAVGLLAAGPATVRAMPVGGMLRRTSVRIVTTARHGHALKVISWRPGDRHVAALVGYRRRGLAPAAWGTSNRRNLAVLNGGTWSWQTGVPTGTVVSRGRLVHVDPGVPAVGFTHRGDIVLGTRAARAARLPNIIDGKAYLVLHGRAVHRRPPRVTPTQWACGPPGTDGPHGCYRSVIAKFRNGRVGMVEIAYASMPAAARILVGMGAQSAITFDSGGSATLWSAAGHGGCPQRGQRGSCFGITQRIRMRWQRPVPTVTELRFVP